MAKYAPEEYRQVHKEYTEKFDALVGHEDLFGFFKLEHAYQRLCNKELRPTLADLISHIPGNLPGNHENASGHPDGTALLKLFAPNSLAPHPKILPLDQPLPRQFPPGTMNVLHEITSGKPELKLLNSAPNDSKRRKKRRRPA